MLIAGEKIRRNSITLNAEVDAERIMEITAERDDLPPQLRDNNLSKEIWHDNIGKGRCLEGDDRIREKVGKKMSSLQVETRFLLKTSKELIRI